MLINTQSGPWIPGVPPPGPGGAPPPAAGFGMPMAGGAPYSSQPPTGRYVLLHAYLIWY